MMTYEFYLRRPSTNSSWRPAFVRNLTNFANKIENYRTNNKTFMLGSQIEIHETNIKLSENYIIYFMAMDDDGEVYGKGVKPSTSLH